MIGKVIQRMKEIGPSAPHCLINTSLYPLARFVLPKIKSRTFHVWFHIIVGTALAYILFLNTVLFPIIVTTVSYFLIDKDPRLCTFLAILTNCGTIVHKIAQVKGRVEV